MVLQSVTGFFSVNNFVHGMVEIRNGNFRFS